MKRSDTSIKTILTILVLSSFFLVFYCPYAKGYATDWEMFGGDYSPLWNSQYGSLKGNLSSNTNITINAGVVVDNPSFKVSGQTPAGYHYQPIVWGFDSPQGSSNPSKSENYLIIPTTNALQIYNKDGVLFSEISTGGNVMTQVDVLDFDQDGLANEIEGVWKVNTTDAQYRIYLYNTTSSLLSLTYTYNLSANSTTYFTGMRRCGTGTGCLVKADIINATNYKNIFYMFNKTATLYSDLRNTTAVLNKPLAFYDMDNDGKVEYLTHSPNDVIIFNQDGTTRYYVNQVVTNSYITDVGMLKPDATNQWKFYYITSKKSATPSLTVTALKLDGTSYWSKSLTGGNYDYLQYATSSIFDDYEHIYPANCSSYLFGLWIVCPPYTGGNDIGIVLLGSRFTTTYTSYLTKIVLRGSDGATLFEDSATVFTGDTGSSRFANYYPTLILADMDKQAGQDFNIVVNGFLYSISTYNNNATPFFRMNGSNNYSSFTIADLNIDGTLDLIAWTSAKTQIFYSNTSNNNAVINGVSYSPSSTSITTSDTLNVYITASDLEGDVIKYAIKCNDTSSWVESLGISSLSCSPYPIGIYNVSVGVRDSYHSNYDIRSVLISVTSGGGTVPISCGNGICETGETLLNCASDCSGGGGGVISGGVNGSSDGTIDLVNTDPERKYEGILPSIYLGTLAFFSFVLPVLIPFVFIMIVVLIILALAGFVKHVASKVGS
jgi:hypothetical protein